MAPRAYQTMWKCVCECGTERVVSGSNLTAGNSTSCGCVRPTTMNRDYSGVKNPRAMKNLALYGEKYVSSRDVWYKRASNVFYHAKRHHIPISFPNIIEFAAYIKSIAPDKCPVFKQSFVERGNGFDKLSPSIDKIDPDKGYVHGNIQVISMLANCMKRDATESELKQFAEWVLHQ